MSTSMKASVPSGDESVAVRSGGAAAAAPQPSVSAAINSMKLSVAFGFGSQAPKIDALQSFSSTENKDYPDRLLHKIGKHVCAYDPETKKKTFLARPKTVVDVLHFAISPNGKLLSLCETARHHERSREKDRERERDRESASLAAENSVASANASASLSLIGAESHHHLSPQVAVYKLDGGAKQRYSRYRTCHHPVSRPFVCSAFCGDQRMLAALTDDPERQVVVWLWEKEKLFKTVSVPVTVSVSLLRGAPCVPLMLSTSGAGALKCWAQSADGTLKSANLLPSAKEALDIYSDHVWLSSALGLHRMVALADPDPQNDLNKLRKQCLYVFEGQEMIAGGANSNKSNKTAAERPGTASNANNAANNGSSNNNNSNGNHGATSALPFNLELKQTIHLKLEPGARVEKIVPANKSFSVVGMYGVVITYERTDDKHEPYVEARRLSLGDVHLIGGTVYPSEEKMVLLTKHNRMLSMAMDITPEQLKKYAQKLSEQEQSMRENNASAIVGGAPGGRLESESLFDEHSFVDKQDEASQMSVTSLYEAAGMALITDVTDGGYHTSSIIAADIALERPIIATIGNDWTCRVWNYLTGRCDLVHFFRQDEPITVACHPAGFQIVISFKDRVRMYNVLNDKLKMCRETVLKNTKVLKFSHGGQYLAAASTINVMIYETRSFQQLMNCQGHMMTITRLAWAPGDQVLFSAGLDGNVYGWPIAREGRIDVLTASNRSSQMLDIAVDCASTVFPASSRSEEDSSAVVPVNASMSAHAHAHSHAAAIARGGAESVPYNTLARSWLVVTSLDGHMRMPHWYAEQAKAAHSPHSSSSSAAGALPPSAQALISSLNKQFPTTADPSPVLYGDPSIYITCVAVAHDRAKLFAGTSSGSIRVYPWPPEPGMCPNAAPSFAAATATASSSALASSSSLHSHTHSHTQSHTQSHSHSHSSSYISKDNNNNTNNNTNNNNYSGANNILNMYSHHHMCYEVYVHCGPVLSLSLGSVENSIISVGADGSVFVFNYEENPALIPKPPKPSQHASSAGDTIGSQALVAGAAAANALLATTDFSLDGSDENMILNNEVVLLSTEDIEEHVNKIHDLQKLLIETKSTNDFVARKLESEHHETLKRLSEHHEAALNREKDYFEKQRGKFDGRIRELLSTLESKENEHIKILTELENKYEHKLADQLERYDLLSEKMTLLKQKCEALLEAEKTSFNKQMNEFKNDANTKEKKLRSENRRAIEDKAANENAFREIIDQQEDEYEDELRQLIKAAEGELVSERETILKLRTLVQTKNTKLDQLKNKLVEVDATSKARLQLLNIERGEKQKLLDTIEHYKKNLIEREDALAEKEKIVLELRSKTRTLENFRFVLDHRLQQLSSERGPITNHIEGLEKHIATMYEELVEEFSLKKAAQDSSSLKDQKIQWISQDLNKTRQAVREKEQYIAAFKRELSNLVASMVVGKELEESVKLLYRKFVRGEQGINKSFAKLNVRVAETVNELVHGKNAGKQTGNALQRRFDLDEQSFFSHDTSAVHGNAQHRTNVQASAAQNNTTQGTQQLSKEVEEALIDTAQEADRQKKFVERQSHNLKHRLRATEKEAHLMSRHRLHENSDLLFECNDLRAENKALQREMDILKHDLDLSQRAVHELRREVSELRKASSTSPSSPHRTHTHSHTHRERERGAAKSDQAQWVVHNTLVNSTRPLSSSPTRTSAQVQHVEELSLIHNDSDEDSLQSLHGVAALLRKREREKEKERDVLSYSMPNLHTHTAQPHKKPSAESDASPEKRRGVAKGNGGLRDKLSAPLSQSISLSHSHSQPLITRAVGAVAAGSAAITIPRADISADLTLSSSTKAMKQKPTSSMAGVGVPASAAVLQNTVERLTQEVGALAQQLDDTLREREMQRMELSRLRKQLMLVSQQQQGPTGGSTSGSLGVAPLPSLVASNSPSLPPQHTVHFDKDTNAQTHADIFGVPSEEDKQSLRLAGRSKTPGGGNSANASVASSRGTKKEDSRTNFAKQALSRENSRGKADLRDFSLHSFDSGDPNR